MTPLRLPAEDMRTLGGRAVEEIVRHLTTLRDAPIGRLPGREELEKVLDIAIPEGPTPPLEVFEAAVRDVLSAIAHLDHPRFLAYIPGPSTYIGAVADFLASGLNVFAGDWRMAAGPAVVERVTVDWLRQLCGLPDSGGGLFVSGGTMASLVPIHAARVDRLGGPNPDGIIYLTAQTNPSIRRGLGFLGMTDSQIRVVAVDDHCRLDPADLRARITADRQSGLRPFCVVATAGTTRTGAIDPLPDVAGICAAAGLWLHVDAAYGGAAIISGRVRHLLIGLDRADSIALDPHKWWFTPYEAGCVLVRDATTLPRAYRLHVGGQPDGAINYFDHGPQLTRGFRALKLWMSLRTFGLGAFREAVEHGLALAEHAEVVLAGNPRWEVVTGAQLAVLTFRPQMPGMEPSEVDALVRRIAAATLHDGYAMVLATELDGRPVLRLCTTNPETTRDDITAVIDRLGVLADDLTAAPR